MTKNPFLNALAAIAYIVLVVFVMNFVAKYLGDKEDGLIAPMLALSLFTLSASVMGYLFVFQPVKLYLDGEKQAGVKLFVGTVAIFAVITLLVLVAALVGIGR